MKKGYSGKILTLSRTESQIYRYFVDHQREISDDIFVADMETLIRHFNLTEKEIKVAILKLIQKGLMQQDSLLWFPCSIYSLSHSELTKFIDEDMLYYMELMNI